MSKSKLSNAEILALRESGMTLDSIAEKAGITRKAVSKRLRSHSRKIVGVPGSEEEKLAQKRQMVLDHFQKKDIASMTPAQKITAIKALTPRKRGRRGDLDSKCEAYVATVAGKTFTKGAPLISEESTRKLFRSVMDGTWVPPDMSKYRLPSPKEVDTDAEEL